MGRAAAMLAHGKGRREVAAELGVCPETLRYWRRRWKEHWQALIDTAAEALIKSVRAMAGTDAILEDAATYWRKATLADHWAAATGKELFSTPPDETTLSSFYRDWYLPNRLSDARAKTKEAYATAVKHWRLLTGDPPVKAVTSETIARFRDALSKMRGLKPATSMSVNSVRSYLRMAQVLLDKLGPPGRGNRDGLGILSVVPWAKPPREIERIPQTVTLEQLSACLRATETMRVPVVAGISAPSWWRALLLVAWGTGLRIGTILSIRVDEIDWMGRRLVLPAERFKSRRPMVVHLNPPALHALRAIQGERELVFPWTDREYRFTFYRQLHRLQLAAGLAKGQWFGMHRIRKTIASLLWESSPAAAQYAMGHASADVTRKHYVDGGELVARALDALPNPAESSAAIL